MMTLSSEEGRHDDAFQAERGIRRRLNRGILSSES